MGRRRILAVPLVLALAAGAAAAAQDAGPISTNASHEVELARGTASWYGPRFHGKRTASGERFDMQELTAAHNTLPLGTRVLVRNLANGREVMVRINDRAGRLGHRIIDLSKAAAAALGFVRAGEARVVLIRPGPVAGTTASSSTQGASDLVKSELPAQLH